MNPNPDRPADSDDTTLIEITDLTPLRILGNTRWSGKARFPGSLRGRSIVVFMIDDQPLAISAFCPHEQANLAEAAFVAPYVLECPRHHNHYDLRTGVIKAYKITMRDEKMYLVWHKRANDAVAHQFADAPELEHRTDGEKIESFRREVESLSDAAALREKQVLESLTQMEAMIAAAERERAIAEKANEDLAAAHEFIRRVTNTMDEVLLVLGPNGKVREANRKVGDLLGLPVTDIIGNPAEHLFSPDTLALLSSRKSAKPAARGGIVYGFFSDDTSTEVKGELLARSGERLCHLFRSAALYDARGKREGVVIVGTDIRQLEQTQRELTYAYDKVAQLLNNMRQAVFVAGPSGRIAEPVSRFATTVFDREIADCDVFECLYASIERTSEAFSLLRTAYLTTFDAPEFQWDLMEEYFPRRVMYRSPPGTESLKVLKIEYCPLRDDEGLMKQLMFVVEDVTRLERLEAEMQTEKQSNVRRIHVVTELARNSPDDLREFFGSSFAILSEARQSLHDARAASDVYASVCGGLHTIKGNARMLGLRFVTAQAHEAEHAVGVHRSGETPEPMESSQISDALDEVHRRISEYSDLAETVFHLPNEFETRSRQRLHAAMVALDAYATTHISLLAPREGISVDVPDRAKEAAVESTFLQAFDEMKQASAVVVDADLHSWLDEARLAVKRLRDGGGLSTGELQRRFRYSYSALVDTVVKICAGTRVCPPFTLARTPWVTLFKAMARVTRDLVDHAGGISPTWKDVVAEAESAARDIGAEYIASSLKEIVPSSDSDAHGHRAFHLLGNVWLHLAVISTVESLVTVRRSDRSSALQSIVSGRKVSSSDAFVLAPLRSRAGLFGAWLSSSVTGDVSFLQLLEPLRNVLDMPDSMSVAGHFISDRDVPGLTDLLQDLTEHFSAVTLHAFLMRCGWSPMLAERATVVLGAYLPRVDTIRILRSGQTVLQGRYELLFDAALTVTVMNRNLHALRSLLRRFKSEPTDEIHHALESAVDRLLDVPLLPEIYRHHEMVAEVSAALGKKVQYRVVCDERISASRKIVTELQMALGHLLRNAMDHGVETAEERQRADKDPVAVVEVDCVGTDDGLTLIVRDDGRGIDEATVLRHARSRGLIANDDSNADVLGLLFAPGFSTRDAVSDISGRGVGLSVVRDAITRMGGKLNVHSKPGEGTEFRIEIRFSNATLEKVG